MYARVLHLNSARNVYNNMTNVKPNNKQNMLPAIIGAIGSIASSVGGSLLSNHSARKNAEIAYQRQRELTLDTPQLNVQGMQRAGLSPAMLNGGSFSSASSPAEAQTVPFNLGDPAIFASIAQSLASAAASKADAENKESTKKLNDENAEAQKLANEKTRNEMSAWQATHPNYIEYPDGTRFYENDPNRADKINEFEKNHPDMVGKAESVTVLKPQSENAYNALYANSKRDAEVSLWRLQKKVNELKLGDEHVMHALQNMDIAQYNQLVELAGELHSQKLLNDETINKILKEEDILETEKTLRKLELQIRREEFKSYKHSNIGSILAKFDDEGFSFSNALKLCIALIAANASFSLHN